MDKDIVAEILTIPVESIDDAMCQVNKLDDVHVAEQQAPECAVPEQRGGHGAWTNGWSNSWTKS